MEAVLEASRTTSPVDTCYRVCRVHSSRSGHPKGVGADGAICPRGPDLERSLSLAWYHLLGNHINTPFISLFNNYHAALKRVTWLQEHNVADICIVFINAKSSECQELYDGSKFAHTFNFDVERCKYHKNEYLHYGSITPNMIMAKMQVKSHMHPAEIPPFGTLCVPWNFLLEIMNFRQDNESPAEAMQRFFDEYMAKKGINDGGLTRKQLIRALCTRAGDALGDVDRK